MRNTTDEREQFIINWADFLARHGKADTGTPRVLDVLLGQYGNKDRHYHHYWHPNGCIALLRDARRDMPEWFTDPIQDAAIEHALIEHDGVFVIGGLVNGLNERWSGELAHLHALQLGFEQQVADLAQWLVRFTTHMDANNWHLAAQIVCDIDIATFAAPWSQFRRHSRLVHKELWWLTEAEFAARNRRYFGKMLVRKRIYKTEYLYNRFEARARANLERVITT